MAVEYDPVCCWFDVSMSAGCHQFYSSSTRSRLCAVFPSELIVSYFLSVVEVVWNLHCDAFILSHSC